MTHYIRLCNGWDLLKPALLSILYTNPLRLEGQWPQIVRPCILPTALHTKVAEHMLVI